jgi:hypothetical protein
MIKQKIDYYENLVNVRSPGYDKILSALSVVRQFIETKNLILVGGMSIDYALKLHGDSIYDDAQLPDYDFYSPLHTEHAYELGMLLCKKGYNNISVITAIHVTTLKVRIDFETVADITYCPLSLFNKIPYLKYGNLRIVHPHYQMIDQHSSLSFPFEHPGREVIFHRWKKDMVRYDLLYKYYPVTPTLDTNDSTGITFEIKKDKYVRGGTYSRTPERLRMSKKLELQMRTVKIPFEKLKNACVCGWGAIDYAVDNKSIIIKLPYGEPISIASYDYNKFINSYSDINLLKYYSEYFGKLPRKVTCSTTISDTKMKIKKMEIFDTYGMLLSAKKINDENNVWVCDIQWSMLYLLIKILDSNNSSKIVFTAEEQYLRCRELVFAGSHPFIDMYGTDNLSRDYANSIRKSKEIIYQLPKKEMQPRNSYPKLPECLITYKFDPETSEYFLNDGRELKSHYPLLKDPYPDAGGKSKSDS